VAVEDRSSLEPDVRAAAVERAAEAGINVAPEDFAVSWQLPGTVPGAEVFVASCPKEPAGTFVVPGLAVYGNGVLTSPQMALTRAFELWLDADGAVTRPGDAAQVACLLYGGADRAVVALDEDSLETVRDLLSEADAALVTLPRAIVVDGEPGVELWWRMLTGVSRVQFYLDHRRIAATRQATPAEVRAEG
jgi:hypothetical protein